MGGGANPRTKTAVCVIAAWGPFVEAHDMTTTTAIETPAEPRRNRFWQYLGSKQLWRDTLYLVILLPFSIVSFTIWVTGVSVTLSLIVFIVGFPIFVGFAMVNRAWCDVERRWAALVLGERIGSRYRPHAKGFLPRVRSIAADPQTWRDFAWMLVDSIVGFAVAVGAVCVIGVILGAIVMPLWYWPLADTANPIDFGAYHVTTIWWAFLTTAIGIALLPLGGWTIRGMALLHANIAQALLAPGSAARVEELTETRAGAVDAAQEELNRIERDLHDGAQARLVALAMDLGMAEKKLADDPEGGRELIGEARTRALETLAELRDLVRGIAPSILRDRGLSAAVASLTAGRQPAIELDIDITRRPSPAAETAAYFVVAEAIANAGKHADEARVRVRHPRGRHAALHHGHRRRPRRREGRCGRRARRTHEARRRPGRQASGREPARWTDDRERRDPVRVVIAEDLALLRDGLTRLLRDEGFDVVAAVDDGDKLVAAVEAHEPDVAIVDVRLPPSFTDEGIRAALEARKRRKGMPVLILSQYVEQTYAQELLADGSGGVGYLLKDRVAHPEEFVAAVRRVAEGGTALDPEAVAQLFAARRREAPLDDLTPREREVLELMAEGRSNAGIARAMVVTEGAVEKHVSSIFGKLGLPPSGDDHRRVLAVLAYMRG